MRPSHCGPYPDQPDYRDHYNSRVTTNSNARGNDGNSRGNNNNSARGNDDDTRGSNHNNDRADNNNVRRCTNNNDPNDPNGSCLIHYSATPQNGSHRRPADRIGRLGVRLLDLHQ